MFERPKLWAAAAGLLLTACLLLTPLAATAAQVIHMDLQIKRQGEAAELYRLVLSGQGDMAQYLLQESQPPVRDTGGFLLTRDAGRTWYAIDAAQGSCSQWTASDVAAAMGGLVSRLKDWASLEITAPSFSKVSQQPAEVICGQPTQRYAYEVRFGFKASILFSSWDYRIVRHVEVWASDKLARNEMRDWLMEVPLRTGHPVMDRLINQGMEEVRGGILKKRVIEAVTDGDGKTTRSETVQTVTRIGQGPAPAVFSPDWRPPPCQVQDRDQLQDVIESLLKKQ